MGMPENIKHRATTARGVVHGLLRTFSSMDAATADGEGWPGEDGGVVLVRGDLRAIRQRLECALDDLDEVIERAGEASETEAKES